MRISIFLATWIIGVSFAAAGDSVDASDSSRNSNDPGDCLEDFEEDKILNCADNCVEVVNTSQLDSDGDGFGNACDGDIKLPNDCMTNFLDYTVVVAAFLSTPGTANWNPDADFNDDGIVNFLDIDIFSDLFLNPPGPSGQASCSP